MSGPLRVRPATVATVAILELVLVAVASLLVVGISRRDRAYDGPDRNDPRWLTLTAPLRDWQERMPPDGAPAPDVIDRLGPPHVAWQSSAPYRECAQRWIYAVDDGGERQALELCVDASARVVYAQPPGSMKFDEMILCGGVPDLVGLYLGSTLLSAFVVVPVVLWRRRRPRGAVFHVGPEEG
jgi:hypothetical protein